jgi:putative ABC transport system substrate-binding protein
MNRREATLAILGLASSSASIRAWGQPGRMPRRVGELWGGKPETLQHEIRAFRTRMRELGWSEGREIVYSARFAGGEAHRYDALAKELVAEKVEVIFAPVTQPALAARRATREIPIVFALAGDPIGDGLVASLARPGGNATGLATLFVELTGKRMQLLQEALPQLRRLAILANPDNPLGRANFDETIKRAPEFGLRALPAEVKTAADIGRLVEQAKRDGAEAIWVQDSSFLYVHRDALHRAAAEARLPTIHFVPQMVDGGGLMSYGPDLLDLFRQAAIYVDRLLRGAKAADLPVQQPTKFELTLNLKTAKALGLVVPQSVLLRAERVIE